MVANIGILRARKARTSVGRRQIAHAHRDGADLQQPYNFPGGATYSFSPPVAGRWKFVGWGPGGIGTGGGAAGASGAYGERTVALNPSQTVTIVAGRFTSGSSTDTVITFPDGSTCTAGKAAAAVAGTASGSWDYSLAGTAAIGGTGANGSPGLGTGGGNGGNGDAATTNGGAGAPGRLPYRGGNGGGSTSPTDGTSPGAGGGQNANSPAGEGLVIVVLMGD